MRFIFITTIMPRGSPALTQQEIEDRINKYGYYFTPKTVYVNQHRPMHLYDAQTGGYVNLSLRQMQ